MKATSLFSIVLSVCASAQTTPTDLWTVPVPLAEVNTSAREWSPFLSFDGLTLYFARQDGIWWHIYEARRDAPSGPFTTVEVVPGELDSSRSVVLEWVSPDNLRMYYTAINGVFALQFSERRSADDPWPQGTPIVELNSLGRRLVMPRLTPDEKTVIFSASDIPGGQGGYDLWMATRPDRAMPFDNVTNLRELNTPAEEHPGCITPDGLALYFSSNRDGSHAVFRTTRPTINNHFDPPVHLWLFDVSGFSLHPAIAGDGSALYFVAEQESDPNTQDIWVSYSGSGYPPDSLQVGSAVRRVGPERCSTIDSARLTALRSSTTDKLPPAVP